MATKKASPGFIQDDYDVPKIPDYVIAELRYDSSVVIATEGKFEAPAAAAAKADALNKILGAFSIKRFASHFDLPQKKLAARAKAVTAPDAKVNAEFAHGGFVQIVPEKSTDAVVVLDLSPFSARGGPYTFPQETADSYSGSTADSSQAAAVWQAYVAPRPVPAAMAGCEIFAG